MLTVSIILLSLALLEGLALAAIHFRGAALPISLALLHGAAVVAGLLAFAVVLTGIVREGSLGVSFGLFIVAALGGFYLFAYHLRGQELPSPVVVVHALVAVAAFVLTLLTAGSSPGVEARGPGPAAMSRPQEGSRV